MLRVALVLLIAVSAVPAAAAAPGVASVFSDERAAMVTPTARPEATATASPTRPAASISRAVPTIGPKIEPTETDVPQVVDNGGGALRSAAATTGTVASPAATPSAAVTPSPTVTPPPPPGSIDLLVATRGDHRLQHDITLEPSLRTLSWGLHGTEDNKDLPAGNNAVAPWLVVERDASQIDASLDARFNIRNIRCYAYLPSTRSWIEIYNGLPGWMVSSDVSTADGYEAIAPTIEPDGSYSFDVPIDRALHMASGVWRPTLSESGGVVTTVEARLIGPDADQARYAVAPGADFRTGDDYATTNQAGFGHLGLLTPGWRTYDMLSSALTDDEIRADPPPAE